MKLTDLDHPAIFAIAITFTVIGMASILSWGASSLNMTGLLGLLKGGVH